MSNDQEPKIETEAERLARLLAADKHVEEAEAARVQTVEAKGLDAPTLGNAPPVVAPHPVMTDEERATKWLEVSHDEIFAPQLAAVFAEVRADERIKSELDAHLSVRLQVAQDALRSTLADIDAAEATLKDLQARIGDTTDHLNVVGEEHTKLLTAHARELAENAVDREKWRAELEGYFGKKVGLQAEHETLQRTLLQKAAIINTMIVSATEEKSDAPG